jgi:hypothetical protein
MDIPSSQHSGIKNIGEDFAAFFLSKKLYNRVFPEKMVRSQRSPKKQRDL